MSGIKHYRMAECHPDRPHYGHGYCKSCCHKAWRLANPEKRAANLKKRYAINREKYLAKNRLFLYGVTPEQYRADVIGQAGRCLICLRVPKKNLVIDHDHATGLYRGLLCNACNSGLGYFRDDPARMRSAIRYIAA